MGSDVILTRSAAGWQRSIDARPAHAGGGSRLLLLGGWALIRDETRVDVVPSGQRLLALLALRGRQSRSRIAGTLWPDTSESQALANLRSTIWRLHSDLPSVVDRTRQELELTPGVQVDVHEFVAIAQRLLEEQLAITPDRVPDYAHHLPHLGELLPGWYDDWVLLERERIHQLRVHALEALAERLAAAKRYGEAVDVALAAVSAEPFRESAHCAVVRAHLAEGNPGAALRHYWQYYNLLDTELGMEPSQRLLGLVAPYLPGR
ncbi:MAG: AfsR/SARP family transcriptional regulator [Carbonactinosporaceae bacterium]